MSTIYVHPDVPKWWGRSTVRHTRQTVAWIPVEIVGVSLMYNVTDARTEVVQAFIDAMGWSGTAINSYQRHVRGSNCLMEYSGGSVIIEWPWDQVFKWLSEGWPTKRVSGNTASPVGTWCYRENEDPAKDHRCWNPDSGWPYAMKQMRRMGIAHDVRTLSRPITELEIIDGLCGALKKHRVKYNEIHA